ncbi:hypothetical protein Tco_1193068 [Tanacetum coccineum]
MLVEILKPFLLGRAVETCLPIGIFSSDKVQFNYTIFNLFLYEVIPSMDMLVEAIILKPVSASPLLENKLSDNATYSATANGPLQYSFLLL